MSHRCNQHNWDNIGLRLTESGSVKIDNVAVPWEDALGWDAKEKKPLEAILKIPWATLLLPTYAKPPISRSPLPCPRRANQEN
jgi:hypothetical protein